MPLIDAPATRSDPLICLATAQALPKARGGGDMSPTSASTAPPMTNPLLTFMPLRPSSISDRFTLIASITTHEYRQCPDDSGLCPKPALALGHIRPSPRTTLRV